MFQNFEIGLKICLKIYDFNYVLHKEAVASWGIPELMTPTSPQKISIEEDLKKKKKKKKERKKNRQTYIYVFKFGDS